MRRLRRGFTIIEMLVVFLLVGILSSIAILRYIDFKRSALAAKVASEMNAIKIAAYTYWSESAEWPAETGSGVGPPELANILSQGFPWTQPEYELDWQNFTLPGGGGGGGGGYLLGITVTADDPQLITKLRQLLGTNPFFAVGNTLTYVIVSADGQF